MTNKQLAPWLPDHCVMDINHNPKTVRQLMRYARKYRDNGDKVLAFHYHDRAVSLKLSNEAIHKLMNVV